MPVVERTMDYSQAFGGNSLAPSGVGESSDAVRGDVKSTLDDNRAFVGHEHPMDTKKGRSRRLGPRTRRFSNQSWERT